jgi:hypothetical protein
MASSAANFGDPILERPGVILRNIGLVVDELKGMAKPAGRSRVQK